MNPVSQIHRDCKATSVMCISCGKISTFSTFNIVLYCPYTSSTGKDKTQLDKARQQPDLCWTIWEQWAGPANLQRPLLTYVVLWFCVLLKVHPGLRYWGCEFSAHFIIFSKLQFIIDMVTKSWEDWELLTNIYC